MNGQDISVELFGQKYNTPLIMAPIGVQGIFHDDKDTGLAEVCAEEGVPYTMSTAGTSSIEEVAAASGDGKRWYQLYWPQDNDITQSLLTRAKENGFSVLVITLDTWSLAWRPADLDNAYVPFIKGVGCQVGFSDPVFRAKFKEQTGKPPDRVILFRDGVGDGDIPVVANYEVPQLIKAVASYEAALAPKVTCVVVQKRVNTRVSTCFS